MQWFHTSPPRWVDLKTRVRCSWNVALLPQILQRFPLRSHSLWCLLYRDPCFSLQIPWSVHSKSPYSSTALSWPHGTEFADSCLKLMTFSSSVLTHILGIFLRMFRSLYCRLADVDYRKSLAAMRKMWEIANWPSVFGISATVRTSSHTIFQCIGTELVPAKFLLVCFKYDCLQWIYPCTPPVCKLEKVKFVWPYVPFFGLSRASALLHTFSHKKSVRRNSGVYQYGDGDKSIIWYWEFDVEKRYFHQFRTIDYAAAVEFYKANKFMMWGETRLRRRQPGRLWERGSGLGRFLWPYYWAWARWTAWGRDWCSRSEWWPDCSGWQWWFQRQWLSAGQWGEKGESGYCSLILETELVPKKMCLYIILLFFCSVESSTSACRTIWVERSLFQWYRFIKPFNLVCCRSTSRIDLCLFFCSYPSSSLLFYCVCSSRFIVYVHNMIGQSRVCRNKHNSAENTRSMCAIHHTDLT